jgi:dTDP-4-dehydrorhamnose reductase
MLPRNLLKIFPKSKIIHFNTDCVFSGKTGNYSENHKKDCNDIYGISKSLGEVSSKSNYEPKMFNHWDRKKNKVIIVILVFEQSKFKYKGFYQSLLEWSYHSII